MSRGREKKELEGDEEISGTKIENSVLLLFFFRGKLTEVFEEMRMEQQRVR
jgi:hypothetical protein